MQWLYVLGRGIGTSVQQNVARTLLQAIFSNEGRHAINISYLSLGITTKGQKNVKPYHQPQHPKTNQENKSAAQFK